MTLRPLKRLVAVAALAAAVAYGCGPVGDPSPIGPMVDAGARDAHDGGGGGGGGGFDQGDAGSCGCGWDTAALANFTAPPYKPARQTAGACSTGFITAFYNDCLAPNATQQTCAPWGQQADAPHKTCVQCLVTADTAASLGPLVSSKGFISVNIPGCMELKGDLACAKAYQTANACQKVACQANCPVTEDSCLKALEDCQVQAATLTPHCKPEVDAAKCADAQADGGPAAVCFQGQTLADLYDAVAPVFCGP